MLKFFERWCKEYINKWLHVEREPPEGWIRYCLYKIYFRWRNPTVGLRDLQRGGKAELEFHRKEFIPVKDIHFTHPVAGDFTDLKLKNRIKKLRTIDQQTTFSQIDIQALLPSINNIRVIYHDNKYKVCDGNGRVYAFQQAIPTAIIEVDLVKPVEDPIVMLPPPESRQARVGDLRVERKFAVVPTQCLGEISHTGTYYSLEEYYEEWQSYSKVRKWRVLERVAESNPQLTRLLSDPDPKRRKLGQMLYKIVRGEPKKEEVDGN